jgi:hypothetical protein
MLLRRNALKEYLKTHFQIAPQKKNTYEKRSSKKEHTNKKELLPNTPSSKEGMPPTCGPFRNKCFCSCLSERGIAIPANQ